MPSATCSRTRPRWRRRSSACPPVLGPAHQQRPRRRGRPGDFRALHHPDPRPERRRPQRQRRRVAGADGGRRPRRSRHQPAAHPRAGRAVGERHQQPERPRRAERRSHAARRRNRPRGQAGRVQRHQAARRFLPRPAVPGRRQRRPGHRHPEDRQCAAMRASWRSAAPA